MLIDGYSDFNKVVLSPELIWTETAKERGSWVHKTYTQIGGVDEVEVYHMMDKHIKHKIQSYQFVGMTEDAAKDCAEAMVTEWTLPIYVSEWDQEQGIWLYKNGGSICFADVKCEWVQGDMWQVNVDVNVSYECLTKQNESPIFPN